VSVVPEEPVWTLDDLLELPDDGRRYELIWGTLVLTPAPWARHADIVDDLSAALRSASPAGWRVRTSSGVIVPGRPVINAPAPDIQVTRRDARADPYPFTKDVLLVVEVSLSTLYWDRTAKAEAYAAGGIPWYWLVGADGSLTVHRLDGDGYVVVQVARPGEGVRLEGPFPVDLDPGTLGA
jgi:Uma2 family endonuclease